MWSGLYPARLAVTEDDGMTWSELKPVGDWGGIVVMGFVEPLKTGQGHYLAMFHDDGRFFQGRPDRTYGEVPTGKRSEFSHSTRPSFRRRPHLVVSRGDFPVRGRQPV